MHDVEVLVVGLGAVGSATLYHLARRGVAAVGLEQYQTGHGAGSSHGHSRAFRIFYHDPLYVSLCRAAIPLWRELESRAGKDLFTLNGGLLFARPDNEKFQQSVKVMEEIQQPHEVLTAQEVADRFTVFRVPEGSIACYTPSAGFLNATRAVQTHATQAQKLGATTHEGTTVQQLDLDGERPVVHTQTGSFRCTRLVLTPGPWASTLCAQLDLPLTVTRQQKFYFQPRNPAGYQPHRMPVYGDYDSGFYGFPCIGPGLKVADDTEGEVTAPDRIDRTLDLLKRDQLRTWLEAIMPGIDATFIQGSTCMYTLTPDRDFLIGRHPKHKGLLLGAGFSGHGFKFSTLVGQILADLTTDATTPYPIERFRPDRFHTTQ